MADRKFFPDSYDMEKRVMRIGNDGWANAKYYVRLACHYYYVYADPDMLLWLIENAWIEVYESEFARDIIAELVRTKTLGKVGISTEKQRFEDNRNPQIYGRVWYYIGMGYRTRYSNNAPVIQDSASALAGAEFGLTGQQAYKIWKRFGGENPVGAFELAMHRNRAAGQMAKKAQEAKEKGEG